MKGLEIKRENEKPMYLFGRSDVVSAIAHAIYYTANPESEMCIPNCAYERAEKEFDDWFNDTRVKKAIETLNEDDKLTKAKKIIKKLYSHVFQGMGFMEINDYNVQKAEAEQFIKE